MTYNKFAPFINKQFFDRLLEKIKQNLPSKGTAFCGGLIAYGGGALWGVYDACTRQNPDFGKMLAPCMLFGPIVLISGTSMVAGGTLGLAYKFRKQAIEKASLAASNLKKLICFRNKKNESHQE